MCTRHGKRARGRFLLLVLRDCIPCISRHLSTLLPYSLSAFGHWQVYGNNDFRHFLLQLAMSSDCNTWSRGLSFNGPIWSVSLEIVVYGLFFLSLFVLRRHPLVVSTTLCTAFWAWVVFEPVSLPFVRLSVFLCAGYFFLGCVLYSVGPYKSFARFATILVLSLGMMCLGLVIVSESIIVASASVALLTIATGLDRCAPTVGKKMSRFGDISYSLYLVHVPLQMTVLVIADLAFDGTRAFANSYLTLPIYMAVSIAFAYWVHVWFERPAGRFIRQRLTSAS